VQRFGKEAAEFTRRMAEGKRIGLDYDDANKHIDHKDRYGRTLAYVFLEDGTLLNAEIIRQSYGHALTRYPFSRLEEFRRLEHEARGQRRGLWRAPVGN
jgi:micrococcal nuclease